MRSHHALYTALLTAEEHSRADREHSEISEEDKLCATECAISLCIALPLVTVLAINLVNEIPYIVKERGISETFLGLILVPIVEKAAEHLTTVQVLVLILVHIVEKAHTFAGSNPQSDDCSPLPRPWLNHSHSYV